MMFGDNDNKQVSDTTSDSKMTLEVDGKSPERTKLKDKITSMLTLFRSKHLSIIKYGEEPYTHLALPLRIIKTIEVLGFLKAVEKNIDNGVITDIEVIGRDTERSDKQSDILLSSKLTSKSQEISNQQCMIVTCSNGDRVIVDLGSLLGTWVEFEEGCKQYFGCTVSSQLLENTIEIAKEHLRELAKHDERMATIEDDFTTYIRKYSESEWSIGGLFLATNGGQFPWIVLPPKETNTNKITLDLGWLGPVADQKPSRKPDQKSEGKPEQKSEGKPEQKSEINQHRFLPPPKDPTPQVSQGKKPVEEAKVEKSGACLMQ